MFYHLTLLKYLHLFTANEAAGILQKQESLQPFQATLEDLLSDVQDHFHLFNGLENMLKSPPRLQNQQVYQIDEATQAMLIEKLGYICILHFFYKY